MFGYNRLRPVLGRICLPLVLVLPAVSTGGAQNSPYSSIKRPKALVRSGCGSQAAEFPRRALARALTAVNIPTVYIEDLALLTPENLSRFDIFINSGSVDAMTPEQEKAISDFVQNGGGFLALHNASAGPRGGLWEQLIGGRFLKHPPPYNIRIHVTEAGSKSPITAGVQDFEVVDEHHFVSYMFEPQPPGTGPAGPWQTSFWTGAPQVLFETIAVDNSMDPDRAQYGDFARNNQTHLIGGWSRDVGKGRMVFFSPGHMAEVMDHPMMQKLYQNALQWLARQN